MRLFVAINFSDAARKRFSALCGELRFRSSRGTFALPENLHLTLVFLGECDAKQAAAANQAMDGAKFEPFDFQVDRVGRFRRPDGDIWWAGLRGCKPLMDLQRELTDSLAAAGFALEKREYKPHITLGRKVVSGAAPWQIEPFQETASSIDLMKSEVIAGKLTYAAIHCKKALAV